MADYTLYNRLRSGGAVVEAALRWAGADFELVELDSLIGTPLPESFKGTNPWDKSSHWSLTPPSLRKQPRY